jgi:hypothetical protein
MQPPHVLVAMAGVNFGSSADVIPQWITIRPLVQSEEMLAVASEELAAGKLSFH